MIRPLPQSLWLKLISPMDMIHYLPSISHSNMGKAGVRRWFRGFGFCGVGRVMSTFWGTKPRVRLDLDKLLGINQYTVESPIL